LSPVVATMYQLKTPVLVEDIRKIGNLIGIYYISFRTAAISSLHYENVSVLVFT